MQAFSALDSSPPVPRCSGHTVVPMIAVESQAQSTTTGQTGQQCTCRLIQITHVVLSHVGRPPTTGDPTGATNLLNRGRGLAEIAQPEREPRVPASVDFAGRREDLEESEKKLSCFRYGHARQTHLLQSIVTLIGEKCPCHFPTVLQGPRLIQFDL